MHICITNRRGARARATNIFTRRQGKARYGPRMRSILCSLPLVLKYLTQKDTIHRFGLGGTAPRSPTDVETY